MSENQSKSIMELDDDYLGNDEYKVNDFKAEKLEFAEYCIHDVQEKETKNGNPYLFMILKSIENDFTMFLKAHKYKDKEGFSFYDFDKVIQAVISGVKEAPIFKTKMQALKFCLKKNVSLKFEEKLSSYSGEMEFVLKSAKASKFGSDKPAF